MRWGRHRSAWLFVRLNDAVFSLLLYTVSSPQVLLLADHCQLEENSLHTYAAIGLLTEYCHLDVPIKPHHQSPPRSLLDLWSSDECTQSHSPNSSHATHILTLGNLRCSISWWGWWRMSLSSFQLESVKRRRERKSGPAIFAILFMRGSSKQVELTKTTSPSLQSLQSIFRISPCLTSSTTGEGGRRR